MRTARKMLPASIRAFWQILSLPDTALVRIHRLDKHVIWYGPPFATFPDVDKIAHRARRDSGQIYYAFSIASILANGTSSPTTPLARYSRRRKNNATPRRCLGSNDAAVDGRMR